MSTAHVMLPPLRDGDTMTREEFLRRWEAMPELRNAELIDGVVHLSSPVGFYHGKTTLIGGAWLFQYTEATPGCEAATNATWLMGPRDDAPQPDLALPIMPEYGGKSRFEESLVSGVPELVVEVSHSTGRHDLGAKLRLYQQSGVLEYISWLIRNRKIIWRELIDGKYRQIQPDADGILRSRVFPGLWLDAEALLSSDTARLIAVLQQGIASPEHAEFVRRLNVAKRKT